MIKSRAARSGGPSKRAADAPAFRRATVVAGAAALCVELLMLAAIPAVDLTRGHEPLPVAHSDLDLTSARDLAVLDLRVIAAARAACRASDRVGSPLVSDRRCVADTVARSRLQVAEVIRRRRASISAASWSGLGVD